MTNKRIIALLLSLPLICAIPTNNIILNKQILKGDRKVVNQSSSPMGTELDKSNLLLKELEHKRKEYNKQQEEQKKKIEEEKQRKLASIPSEVLNRGGGYEEINLRVSFYTVSYEDCGNTKGRTASGKRIRQGMIAMPKDIEFGTQIYIENMGTYTCEDRGGLITYDKDGTMKVDVYVPNATQKQLRELGVKYLKGYILNK